MRGNGNAIGSDAAISNRQTTCDYPGNTMPKFRADFQRDGTLRATKVAAVAGRLRGRPRDSPDCPFSAPNRDWIGCGPVWYCDRAASNGQSVTRSFFFQKARCAGPGAATLTCEGAGMGLDRRFRLMGDGMPLCEGAS